MRKPARLNALTGLRCFAAINIVFFHFSNPNWFGFMAPVVNAGYASVSFFILLSGYVMAYNYAAKARTGELDVVRFYEARFTRLYPIYLLSLVLAWQVVPLEYTAHTHAMFWTGMVLSPLLLQGWIPAIATFLNTPAWTMSAESFYYLLFPWMAKWKRPEPQKVGWHLSKMFMVWMLGLVPGTLYIIFSPDGIAHPDRWSYGPWLQALKYTPLPHLCSFIFGVMIASLDELIDRWARRLVNVHVEDMRAGVHEHLMFGEGEIDFPAVLRGLSSARYVGGVHVELSRHSHEGPFAAQKAYDFLTGVLNGL